jgi:hypothetical protein
MLCLFYVKLAEGAKSCRAINLSQEGAYLTDCLLYELIKSYKVAKFYVFISRSNISNPETFRLGSVTLHLLRFYTALF